jgi:hypothetical protein
VGSISTPWRKGRPVGDPGRLAHRLALQTTIAGNHRHLDAVALASVREGEARPRTAGDHLSVDFPLEAQAIRIAVRIPDLDLRLEGAARKRIARAERERVDHRRGILAALLDSRWSAHRGSRGPRPLLTASAGHDQAEQRSHPADAKPVIVPSHRPLP